MVPPPQAAHWWTGGYSDVLGTPAQGLAFELDFVDQTLGRIVAELKKQGLYDSTLIIICAKHGQSPIDLNKKTAIGNGQPATLIGPAEAFDISDDGSLIWLTDQELTSSVVETLSKPANQKTLGIQEIFAGQSLKNKWDDPGSDPRTPDIVLKVNTGVIFTGGSKIAEHGGLNEDDVHAALLVSLPGVTAAHVNTPVLNQQVAPTIVKALGFDPSELEAVKKEQITVLPFLFSNEGDEPIRLRCTRRCWIPAPPGIDRRLSKFGRNLAARTPRYCSPPKQVSPSKMIWCGRW